MKVVVTGGAGFIGSNFIQYMHKVSPETELIIIDKLTYAADLRNLEGISKDCYRLYKADICSTTDIDAIFEAHKPQYVINFAAESHVDRSIDSSRVFIETNVLGTQVLLQAALKYNVERFVQISTDEVYGASQGSSFTEKAVLKPGNPYAASKASADLLVMSYYHTYGLPIVITRCTNNFGPHQHKEKLIPMVIDKCLRGESIPVYGDGEQLRDWIYVEDHCSAVYEVLHKGREGEIYNISADNKAQNIDVVKNIIKELKELLPESDGRRQKINYGLISYVKDRKGHDRCYSIDSHKIIEELNWSPSHDFYEELRNTVRWYVQNHY